MPIEIKSGKAVVREIFSGLEKWMALAGDMAIAPTLVYGSKGNYRHKGIRIIGWQQAPGQVFRGGEIGVSQL